MGISKPKDCYKPLYIRTPAILLLLLLTLALVGLVEYACRTLPTQGFRNSNMMPNITGLRVRDLSSVSIVASSNPESSMPSPASAAAVTPTETHISFLDPSVRSAPSDSPPPVSSAPASSVPGIASPSIVPVITTAIHSSFLDPGVLSPGPPVASPLPIPRSVLEPHSSEPPELIEVIVRILILESTLFHHQTPLQ